MRELREAGGATSVEYAIMASLIAVAVILAVVALGLATGDKYDCTQTAVSSPHAHTGGSC